MTLPLSDAAVRVELPSAADMEKQLREMVCKTGRVVSPFFERFLSLAVGNSQTALNMHECVSIEVGVMLSFVFSDRVWRGDGSNQSQRSDGCVW